MMKQYFENVASTTDMKAYLDNKEILTAYNKAKEAYDACVAECSEEKYDAMQKAIKAVNALIMAWFYDGKTLADVTILHEGIKVVRFFPKVTAKLIAKGADVNEFTNVRIPANVVEWAKVTKNTSALALFRKIRSVCCLIDMGAKIEEMDKASERIKAYNAIRDEEMTREAINKKELTKTALKYILRTMAEDYNLPNMPIAADANHLIGYVRTTKIQEGVYVDRYLSLATFGQSLTQTIHRIVTAGIYEDYQPKK